MSGRHLPEAAHMLLPRTPRDNVESWNCARSRLLAPRRRPHYTPSRKGGCVVSVRTDPRAQTNIEHSVASALKRNGVPYVFGIPGGGSSIDLIEACRQQGVPFVFTQHETSAAMMALVAGRLTDSCGVCVSIMGPGAINLAAGAGFAFWERHPQLCVTECYGAAQAPRMSLQRMDHAQMFSAVCKASVTLEARDPSGQIEEAMRLAATERPGPVHVDFPLEVEPARDETAATSADRSPIATPAKASGDLDAIADAIDTAERPIVVAGPAVHRHAAESHLLRLVERLEAAVLVTSKARGVLPEDHPLFAGVVTGVYGESTLEGRIVHQSDLVVAIGLDRMELLSPWRYPQTMVALDAIEVPEDESVGQPKLTASGPLPGLIDSLADSVRPKLAWEKAELRSFWDGTMHALGAADDTLNAASLLARARELAPRDAILVTETGVYNAVNLYVWKVLGTSTYFGSSGSNTMGFSVPAGLAAALARPEQKTVALVGDGGFLMRASELEVAARLKLSPVIIVFNDGTLGLIRIKQQAKGYPRTGVDLAPTDFVRLAESFGGRGRAVRTLEEFETAFKQALSSDRLTVIDARLDPDTYAAHLRPIRGA